MRALCAALLAVSLPAAAYDIGYSMALDQYKETRRLTNNFTFTQRISETVNLNVDAGFTADRSDDLDRFLDYRTGRAWISWRPSPRIELSSSVARSLQLEERFGSIILDQVDNTSTGEVRYNPSSWLALSMSLGSHILDYESVSGDSTITGHDEGGVHNVSASLNKTIANSISASMTFGEDRTLGRQTDSGSDGITVRVNYSFPGSYDGGSIGLTAGATRMFTTYADSDFSHREQDWSHSLTVTTPTIFEAVSMQISTGWNWNNRYWETGPDTTGQGDPRDRLMRARDVSASLRWVMTDDLELQFNLARSVDRNDRKRTSPGVEEIFDVYDVADDRMFDAMLTFRPGGSRITFQRIIQLYRFDTEGVWEDALGFEYQDNSDRDEQRQLLSLNAEVPLSAELTILGNVTGQRLETVYLESEQSGNSKVSSTYSIDPGYRYDLGDDWAVEHSIKLSADYTTFRFPESAYSGNDLLFRRVDSRFSLMRVGTDSTLLGVVHRLRIQDQGTIESSAYSLSERSLNNTVTVNVGFNLSPRTGITPSYTYEYSRREFLNSPWEPVTEHLHHAGLRTRITLGEGTLMANITRTFYSDNRPSYWKASVGFDYLF